MSKNIVFENLIIEKFNKFRNKNNIWSNDVLDFINEEKDLLEKELDIIEETEYYGIKEEKLDKIRDYCFSFLQVQDVLILMKMNLIVKMI